MTNTVVTPVFRAWHGDAAVQEKFLARMQAHRDAERLVKGIYGRAGKFPFRGCAVGCTLEMGEAHHRYPEELGWPIWLAWMEDRVFEGLPTPEHLAWPEALMRAISVGLPEEIFTRVKRLFLHRLLQEQVLPLSKIERSRQAVQTAIGLYARSLKGDEPTQEEWRAAYAYAAAADDDAAYAAAAAAASAYADAAAADDAAAYAAAAAASYKVWKWSAATLLELFQQEGKAWLATDDGAPYRDKQLAAA